MQSIDRSLGGFCCFCLGNSIVLAPFVERLFSTEVPSHRCEKENDHRPFQLSVFRPIFSITLARLLWPHSRSKRQVMWVPRLYSSFSKLHGLLRPFAFLYEFQNKLVNFYKKKNKACWWSDGDCIEFTDQFGEIWHFNHGNSSDLWIQNTSPFIYIFFNFSLQCFIVFSVLVLGHFSSDLFVSIS